jgi:hypothetical protein
LPPYLRSLTKQTGHFVDAVERYEANRAAEVISRNVLKKRKKK